MKTPRDFSVPWRFLLLPLLLIACLAAGCAKSPEKSEFRAVTSEIVGAIQKEAGRSTAVRIRPEAAPRQFIFFTGPAPDDVSASLANSAQADALRKPLAEIAHSHNLDLAEVDSAGALRFDFSSTGNRTHTVRLQFPMLARTAPRAPGEHASTRLAIILDDMGNDRAADEAVLALPFHLTFSILPHLPLSQTIADEAARRGDQVMLHLPMQAESETTPDQPVELRPGMNTSQVDTILAGMLATVPHASGINNHEGSKATADAALMDALMPALRQRNLFFIDSRTTAATVAFDAAQRAGVPAASRKVFLDDSLTADAIRAQLDLAVRDANQDGEAIAIGHPHPETIAVLREQLPRLQKQGIQLVFASDLVR